MLSPAFNKKFLFGTTVMAGFATMAVFSAPANAQSTASDTTATTTAIQQQSPAQGAPPQAAPDPAVVAQPENPEEARNNAGEPVSDDAGDVEAVVVTGSRIRRDPTNAPAPLIQINREEVLQSGQSNLVDFLADVPALQSSITPTDQTQGGLGQGGLSALNLRNLGTARTLVLIDGRRQVGATIGTLVVDVDTVPSLLIENTEIVTGGQSALYGTDAVAGVVNFILRRNFEGLEIDGSLAELNQDGQLSGRLSGLIGTNILNDRLNLYAFGEYQKDEQVFDRDLDHLREANFLLNVDSDPTVGQPDTQLDNILISGGRTLQFARGGTLVLANQVRPSTGFIPGTNTVADPDFIIQNCGAVPTLAQRQFTLLSTFCGNIVPDQPGKVFVFNADGTARAPNFGTFQDTNGNSRPINVGGDGLNPNTEFTTGARFPDQENFRFQTGFNFDINENAQIFGEAKYVKDLTNFDASNPTFFQPTFQQIPVNTIGGITGTSFNNNIYGLDNAFLPENVRQAILNNTRPVYDLSIGTAANPNPNFGNQTGTIADPRASYFLFGPGRPQFNTRELERFVLGIRGDRDALGFIQNFGYEASYQHSETRFQNQELAVDSERFFYATDAVRNAAGQIVCRVQELSSRGIAIPDPVPNGTGGGQRPGRGGNLDPNSDAIKGCIPINIFGVDLRPDANAEFITGGGGRPGLTPEQRAYITADVSTQDRNAQSQFLAFASGELLENFLPAGPIGIALGYEYRKEEFEGLGRNQGSRAFFLNLSNNNPLKEYSFNEVFGEIRIPLLRDLPFAESAEISGAYRVSESSVESVGKVETYSLQALYRPTRDVLFRATFGQATRVPTLSDLFNQGFGTFALLADPCDANNLKNQADPVIRENRRKNCVALLSQLGAGYDPDFSLFPYVSSIAGAGGAGNPELAPEESRSYTASVVLTPRFIPRFSILFDFYDIKISNAINSVAAQTNLNNCVSGTVLNEQACALFVRNGPTPPGSGQAAIPFGLTFFNAGPLNYASLEAKGIDFNARYSLDTADILPRDLGRLDYSIRGTYNIRQESFFNINDPGDATENDSGVGNPRVRFLSTLSYAPVEDLSFQWRWDWQSSQEILDSDFLLQDPDNRRAEFLETGSFSQHDFNVRYEIRDGITLRAGVVNAFDAEPPPTVAPPGQLGDIFDLFGRRFFVGANLKFGAAVR
jgi:outer membrane receptor protein involved in Fe transport